MNEQPDYLPDKYWCSEHTMAKFKNITGAIVCPLCQGNVGAE